MTRRLMLMLFGTTLVATSLFETSLFETSLFETSLAGMTFVSDARAADEPKPACKTAEVNPVTGHVFCIDPIGAPVETPPDSMKPECEEQSRGQWTWAPSCDPAAKGM
jgi:hypothetical protein